MLSPSVSLALGAAGEAGVHAASLMKVGAERVLSLLGGHGVGGEKSSRREEALGNE